MLVSVLIAFRRAWGWAAVHPASTVCHRRRLARDTPRLARALSRAKCNSIAVGENKPMPVQFETRAIDTRFCIYCSKRTTAADFSLEHLIPQFMGGNAACPDVATRDVCRRCNSLCGRFVDAPVARGFFQNSIDNGAWQHCIRFDAAAGNVFPLIYLGTCVEIAFNDNEESEVWLAPDGGGRYGTSVPANPTILRQWREAIHT